MTMSIAVQIVVCGLLAALPVRVSGQWAGIQGSALDIDINGNVYVVDADRNTLRLYNRSGALEKEIGGPGWLSGQFDRPSSVWARNGIDVFVADYGNHRIERFDRSLNFVSSFSTRESANPDERFGYPGSVALSRLGDLFVCDTENSRIVKVDRFSTVERTFGGFGGGGGRLNSPSGVALGPRDGIYVLDGRRIAVFDPFGNYLRDLFPSLFVRPVALYADDGVVAVVDSATLFMFDANERAVGAFPLSALGGGVLDVRALALNSGSLYLLTGQGLTVVSDPRKLPENNIENNPISR